MLLKQIYDPYLSQYAYLIGCQRTGEALVIDPERDIDRYIDIAEENDLVIKAVAETHIHADFLSGSREFLETIGGVTAYLSNMGGEDWQYNWAKDRVDVMPISDGDKFWIGKIEITVAHLPGHTPEHVCYIIQDNGGGATEPIGIASGDFMFVGDVGRPDLLESAAGHVGAREPAARELFKSIVKFADYPDFYQVMPGHGAGSACGKALGAIPFSTAGYEKRFNSAVRTALDYGEQAFVDDILDGQPEPPMYFARMKKSNRDGVAVLGALPEPEFKDSSELDALLSSDSPPVCIDVRSDRAAFMKKHVRGSIFAPYEEKFSEAVGSYVEPEEDILLLVECASQIDSCVRQLIRIGYDNIIGFVLIDEALEDEGCQDLMREIKSIHTSQMEPEHRILDVRSTREHAEGSVPGATHVAHTRVVADKHQLPELGEITVHCRSGLRASLAASALERMGYEVTLADGMFSEWEEKQKAAEAVSAN